MANETAQRMKQVQEQVERILREYPESRNDDRLLQLMYWQEVDGIELDPIFCVQFATKSTGGESITRARRKMQKDNPELGPTVQEVLQRRRVRQEEMRAHYVPNE